MCCRIKSLFSNTHYSNNVLEPLKKQKIFENKIALKPQTTEHNSLSALKYALGLLFEVQIYIFEKPHQADKYICK